MMMVRKSDYTYDLPEELIADRPASPRDASRLLRVDRRDRTLAHHRFHELPALLEDGTVLVLNNTRVIPARLPGRRDSGGVIDVLLVEETAPGLWRCKVKNAARLRRDERLWFCDDRLEAVMTGRSDDGGCLLRFDRADGLMPALEKWGYAPLPPYIQKVRHQPVEREKDLHDYQTVYASVWGAIAAPTAGLHFSPDILAEIQNRGIDILEVTLHVGPGTFEPIRSDDVRAHQMHSERYHLTDEVAERLNRYRKEGRIITAVGTTVVRTLESAVRNGTIISGSGNTDLFIYPPYRFQVVDRLLTNFHLPESTLLMMVSAFADRELMLTAYREAVQQRYRFFSYGDCMLIR
jgi:S-adenosylmethionine:tRNA ribosyltransferase-isomerase